MRFSVPRSFRLTVLSFAVLAIALMNSAAQAATRTVIISNDRFTDASSGNSTSTIQAGDSVTWVWPGDFHSTTSGSCSSGCAPDGRWDSGEKSTGTFSRTFDTPGSFPYHCSIHLSMMQGTIIVQPATVAPTANFLFQPSTPTIGTQVNFTDTSSGSPTSWLWNFGDPASGTSNTSTLQNPSHVFLSAGTYSVSLTATNSSGSGTTSKSITASNGGGVPCTPSTQQLCLNNDRFLVTASWQKPDGSSGVGSGVKLTGDSGYFWFFDPANIEVVTKVLDGCAITNAYWVFAAGLTNVNVALTVTDTQTGTVYLKENPQGTAFAPIQDTGAFPTSCP
jgi:PKD repeat protein